MVTKKFEDLYNLKCNITNVIKLEKYIYAFANQLSGKQYTGGSWCSTVVKNDDDSFWYFELKCEDTWKITCPNYLSNNIVGTKCFSLLSFVFALNYLMSEIHESEDDVELLNEIIGLYDAVLSNIGLVLNENERKIFNLVID